MAGQLRRVATVPTSRISGKVVEDHKRSVSELVVSPHIPEPFASISAQQLLQENCRHCGWIRKEGGNLKFCKCFFVTVSQSY